MIGWIEQLILQADIVFLLIVFFSEKNSPSKILLWALVLFLMPIVGFILYIFVGQTFYSDNKFKKKGLKDDGIDDILSGDAALADAEPDPEYRRIAKAILNMFPGPVPAVLYFADTGLRRGTTCVPEAVMLDELRALLGGEAVVER